MESDKTDASDAPTAQANVANDRPETGSASVTPAGSERISLDAPATDGSDVHEFVLEDAGEGVKITSPETASAGQMAVVRSSTVKKTKRKTLRRTKRSGKRASEGPTATPIGKFLKEDDDIPTILAHMRKDLSSPPLQLRCLLAIERLVESDAANRNIVSQQNGIELIMESMTACKSNKDVQGSACWVISNLCRNRELNSKIVEKGCIDVVMEMFTTHSTVEHVQHACLATVCNLALNEGTLRKLVSVGVVSNVLRTIRDFPENEWIQYTAVQVLQNAANIGELCPMLMEAKTVPVVVQAMNSCADHDELLQSSLWIFSSLAFTGTNETRIELIECGVLPVIIRSIKECEGHHGVYFTGCSAIANVARADDAVDKIVEAEVVPILLDAIRACLDDPSILQIGCRALVLLLESRTARRQCKDLGCSKLCKKVLELFPEGPVAMEAKQALKLQKTKDKGCSLM